MADNRWERAIEEYSDQGVGVSEEMGNDGDFFDMELHDFFRQADRVDCDTELITLVNASNGNVFFE